MNIPTQVRADYVAYIRTVAALQILEMIPTHATRHPAAAKAIGVLGQWRDGLYKRCEPYLSVESADSDEDEDEE